MTEAVAIKPEKTYAPNQTISSAGARAIRLIEARLSIVAGR